MKREERFYAMLPAGPGRKSGKPYRSTWLMSREVAEQMGGTVIESTMRVLMVPETEDEREALSRRLRASSIFDREG